MEENVNSPSSMDHFGLSGSGTILDHLGLSWTILDHIDLGFVFYLFEHSKLSLEGIGSISEHCDHPSTCFQSIKLN